MCCELPIIIRWQIMFTCRPYDSNENNDNNDNCLYNNNENKILFLHSQNINTTYRYSHKMHENLPSLDLVYVI